MDNDSMLGPIEGAHVQRVVEQAPRRLGRQARGDLLRLRPCSRSHGRVLANMITLVFDKPGEIR